MSQPSAPPPARPPRRRRWPFYLVAALLLGAAAAFAYLSFLGMRPAQNLRSIFVPPFAGRPAVNILVLGADAAGEVRRSDTIIVAHVNLEQKRLAAFSVPRDFRVEIPGHGVQKINSAYSLGGVDLTRRTVESAFQLPIHYYVLVSTSGLRRLVEAMGGVMINVDKRMYYRDRSQGLLIDLRPGYQRLSGAQAEGFVRYRHDALGDLKRIERQQLFLKAVLAQALQPSKLRRMPAMLRAFTRAVQTDLTLRDLEATNRLAQELSGTDLPTATLPGTPVTVRGISYLEPDWAACRETISQVLHGSKALVAVLNGTGQEGQAAQVASRLEAQGYAIEAVGNAVAPAERTQIIAYRKPDSARQIQRILGFGEVIASPGGGTGGADVTVVLGADALGPPAPAGR